VDVFVGGKSNDREVNRIPVIPISYTSFKLCSDSNAVAEEG